MSDTKISDAAVEAAREKFEAWAEGSYHLQRMGDEYRSTPTTQAWLAWQAALAATGKQQVGDTGCGACGDGCADRPACRVAEESPPAQVGEVQGDALADAVGRIFGCDGSPYRTRDLAAVLREFATRQPGAQEPRAWLIHWSHIPLEAPEVTTSASRVDAVSALTDPPRIEPLYAARQLWAQEQVTDAAVDKAWSRFEAALQAPDGDTPEDRILGQTIDQRDRYHEVADDLAGHLARITGVEIGEHSSVNCPWQNAIDAAESYAPAQGIDLGQFRAAVAMYEWAHRSLATHSEKLRAEHQDAVRLLALIDSQRDAAPGVGNEN